MGLYRGCFEDQKISTSWYVKTTHQPDLHVKYATFGLNCLFFKIVVWTTRFWKGVLNCVMIWVVEMMDLRCRVADFLGVIHVWRCGTWHRHLCIRDEHHGHRVDFNWTCCSPLRLFCGVITLGEYTLLKLTTMYTHQGHNMTKPRQFSFLTVRQVSFLTVAFG